MEDQKFQEIEKKKKFLKRYRKNLACINRLKNKLDLLDERITSIKSSNLSGMPRGGTPITVEELIADKAELEDRIKRLKKKKVKLRREITEEIDSLEDPNHVEVLEAFFIDCLDFEDIADNMGYSERRIRAFYAEAIERLTFQ